MFLSAIFGARRPAARILTHAILVSAILASAGLRSAHAQQMLDLPSLDEELGRPPLAAPSPSTTPQGGIEARPLPEIGAPPEPGVGEALPEDAPPEDVPLLGPATKIVVLNGLDKITARVSAFRAIVDVPARFGSLVVTARDCHKRPPEDPPETSAFLEISDIGAGRRAVVGGEGRQVFSGWMFASNPALSALEHPVYDIWVMDCITSIPDSGAVTPSGSE